MKGTFLRAAAGAALALGTVTSAASAQLVGTFNVTGTVRASDAGGGVTNDVLLNFGATTADDFVVAYNGTNDFTSALPFPPGTLGLLQNVIVGSGPTSIPAWLQFGTFVFNLENISPGDFGSADCFAAPAAGQSCTPPGTGFNLKNQVNNGKLGSEASVQFSGTVLDAATLRTGRWTASFTQTFDNQSFQALSAIITSGGTITTGFTSEWTVTSIPEPATVTLMVTGLLALGGVAVRRRNMA